MELWHEREDAVVVTINRNEFSGDTRAWQEAYFKILSWKNTWSMTYEVDMLSYCNHDPYVRIVAKREIKNHLVEWLKDIGYDTVHTEDVVIGTCDVWGDEDIYKYYLD